MARESQPEMEKPKTSSNSEACGKDESESSISTPANGASEREKQTEESKPVTNESGNVPSTTPKKLKEDSVQRSANAKVRTVGRRKVKTKSSSKVKAREESLSSSSSDDTESESEAQDTKKRSRKNKAKTKARRRAKVSDSSESRSSSSADDDDDSSEPERKRSKGGARLTQKERQKRSRRRASASSASESPNEKSGSDQDVARPERMSPATSQSVTLAPSQANLPSLLLAQLAALQLQTSPQAPETALRGSRTISSRQRRDAKEKKGKKSRKVEKGSMAEYVRLDHMYSRKTHQWITRPSTEDQTLGEYDGYAFNVLREFDYQERHTSTRLRIRSPHLMKALKQVLGKVPGITLEDINPDLAFLFLDELKAYRKDAKKRLKKLNKIKKKSKKDRKKIKETKLIEKHVKLLTKYVDDDYEETKSDLEPLLKSGKITFELVWALFKANEMLFTHTYSNEEEPRAMKMAVTHKHKSIMEGEYYLVETHYLDYDGKKFGMAESDIKISNFKGARPITSLPVYPLKYHANAEKLTKQLIVRGKKFVELGGMHYKRHTGMAYMKKERKILRVHVDGRVMLDPATFRRLCPNYPFSTIKPPDPDVLPDSPCCSSSENSDGDDESSDPEFAIIDETKPMTKKQLKAQAKWIQKHYKKKICEETDSDEPEKKRQVIEEVFVESDVEEPLNSVEKTNDSGEPEFDDEDYLIASPVILGFSFGQKLWLEFSVDAIGDVEWNEGAFDSLIIPDEKKSIIKALVQSHDIEAQSNIDDIIRGKGKGLVAVLHGPPGTGKTLTAEGLADMLKKPLYSVSAGDLGTSPSRLEQNLSQILDVAHTWRALLLLDEADVFLEARTNYDVGRNALVSIFLRMLEYFEGILFLTTNRVAVFDDAFASRVHIGLRYGGLELKARKKVWSVFLNRVRSLGQGVQMEEFDESDMSRLASFDLNGREIKNAVRTAQSAALINKETLGMKQLLSVLMVGSVFAKDLKGQGYEEALKFYM